MSHRVWVIWAVVALAAAQLEAQTTQVEPQSLSSLFPARPQFLADDPSIPFYPQLGRGPDELVNHGGVHFDLDVLYLSNYIYRGIDQSTLGHSPENALQFDGKLSFDLGKLPHPFVGLFANVFNEDPISRFEEIRPTLGLEWTIRPFKFTGGYNTYLFPNRKPLDTQEVWASMMVDDSLFFRMARPIFSPYVFAAYDLDLYQGYYFEAGIHHDFIFDDLGVTLSPSAHVAYVLSNPQYALARGKIATGFQHYGAGLVGKYSLNTLFNFSRRYGEWSINGYLYYTDGLANHLRADTRIWGGVGMSFSY
jgi:hypothetical protein